ncbi:MULTISPECIES: TatD family hydrolase [Sphingobacterium]|uniref:TatD family hydrolase n=1 Tax=Sphingobacterium TaxID=28453 RepID=UPI0013DD12F9|nr:MULTISPECIES: TatD family hydrolase [unclassified Sphingobacterium]
MEYLAPPFIDIHTHDTRSIPGILQVRNHIVGQDEMASNYLYTAGIHPWYIDQSPYLQLKQLECIAAKKEVLGIGECGLDKQCTTDWDLQIEVFRQQVELANTTNKPIIIHSVRAYQEIVQQLTLQRVQTPVIFHGFNKKNELAQELLKKGYYLSLGAEILLGRQSALITSIPLHRMFLETDNKTTNIVDIFSYFCAARKIPLAVLKQQMAENMEHVFNYRIEE